jgi:hypothetical protein
MVRMEIVLYFRPSPSSKPEKLAGVRDIAEKARIHIQIVDEVPSREQVRTLLSFWKCRGVIVECGGRDEIIDPKLFGSTPAVFFNQDKVARLFCRGGVSPPAFIKNMNGSGDRSPMVVIFMLV